VVGVAPYTKDGLLQNWLAWGYVFRS
jgi:hypothetical protein